MINYTLPTEIEIGGKTYKINKKGDYRMILDVISALSDDSLSDNEKAMCALTIFYNFNIPKDIQKAIDEMLLFINCGEPQELEQTAKPPLMSWEQDFNLLVAPINKALGFEIRATDCLHWWTFVSGYMEIGECQFSTVTTIRQKKQKGIKLDKQEREFYNENRKKVELKVKYTSEEKRLLDDILGTGQ